MKKTIVILALFATAFTSNSIAQESTNPVPAQILNMYYQLKDNLVKSSSAGAAASAKELIRTINEVGSKIVPENTRSILIKDADAISQSKDIELQRKKFTTLSINMFELAKTVNLSTAPVYQQYCPMKKASWLSSEKEIRNPYYGSAMLTCGNVKTTL